MLKADYTPVLTVLDEVVFTQLVPPDHYLRRLKAVVDFPAFVVVDDKGNDFFADIQKPSTSLPVVS